MVLLLEVLLDRMEDSFNFIMQNQKAHAEESNSKSLMRVLRIIFPWHGEMIMNTCPGELMIFDGFTASLNFTVPHTSCLRLLNVSINS